MPAMSVLIKPASGNCNMSCDYCFYCDEAQKREIVSYGRMSEETLRNVLRRTIMSADRTATIAFQGGEPTLCGIEFFEKAVQYARHFNRKKKLYLHFSLQTNGFEISEEWCKFFRDNQFLIGLSIDGTKETHNRYRHVRCSGETTYDRVLKTAEMFDAFGVEYNILTVVHKETAEQIEDIYQSYRKKGWKWQQYVICLDPLGENRGARKYSLTPELYGKFLIQLFNMWYEDFKRGEQPYIRQFENYIGILLGYIPETCEHQGSCGVMYVVEADGSVYPCDFYALDSYRIGNFNQNTVSEMDRERQTLKFIMRSVNYPQKCKSCKYFSLCRGGCFRNRLEIGEGVEGLNYFCEGYLAFFEACYDRLVKIAGHVRQV